MYNFLSIISFWYEIRQTATYTIQLEIHELFGPIICGTLSTPRIFRKMCVCQQAERNLVWSSLLVRGQKHNGRKSPFEKRTCPRVDFKLSQIWESSDSSENRDKMWDESVSKGSPIFTSYMLWNFKDGGS